MCGICECRVGQCGPTGVTMEEVGHCLIVCEEWVKKCWLKWAEWLEWLDES